MRGSFVGLSLDSGLNDLAKKFNVTLEVGTLEPLDATLPESSFGAPPRL